MSSKHNLDDATLNIGGELAELYEKCNPLKVTELHGNHRLDERRTVLMHAPKGGVGAEIGVFTGMFSVVLAEETQPRNLYLVDPWSQLHGEYYPNWGRYTAEQVLSTKFAKAATTVRAKQIDAECEVVEAFGSDWLNGFQAPFLDWVYLDANHKHKSVLDDLKQIARRMREGGVIMGDDCWIKAGEPDIGVAAALNDFLNETDYEIVHLDDHGQWAITQSNVATGMMSEGS